MYMPNSSKTLNSRKKLKLDENEIVENVFIAWSNRILCPVLQMGRFISGKINLTLCISETNEVRT